MKTKILLPLLFSIFVITSSIAGTIDPKAKDADHIEYGNQYKCVVLVRGLTKQQEKYMASAVVIKPQWILTAAHIVEESSDHHVLFNSKQIKIDKIIKPDGFNMGNDAEKDIVICHLEIPIHLDFYPELYGRSDEIGKTVGLSGYGNTGTFSTGAVKADGIKRGGSNTIDRIEKDLLVCSVLNGPITKMEFLIAHGDSGGGLFIEQKLAGIHSMIWSYSKIKPMATYSTYSGHTRISVYKDWILQNIKD